MNRPYRLLMVHPGASFSTADVYNGYRDALTAAGHELIEYRLDERLEVAARFCKTLLRYADREKPPTARRQPNNAMVTFTACSEIVTQALWHKVDAVVITSAMYLHPDFLVLLRRARMPNVVILTESPYDDLRHEYLLPYIDIAFTNERSSLPRLRRINPQVHYLKHAHDPAIHRPSGDDADVPSHDVVFVGTGFPERLELLGGVDWTGIDLALYGTFDLLPDDSPLRPYIKGGVTPNATAAALYRRAKIGLNLYRTSVGYGEDAQRIGHAESLNPRAVELAACGAFHLSDYRDEVGEVFGEFVPTFRDSASLGRQVRHYLAHPDLRAAYAARLPACVAPLTFAAQAEGLVSTLRAVWSGASTLSA